MMQFIRSHARHLIIGACVLVLAGIGVTVGLLTTSGSKSASATPTTIAPTTTVPSATGVGARKHAPKVRGTIASIGTGSWTITTPKGKTLTVVIGPTTHFGGKGGAKATAASFSTGESVVVTGTRRGTTITAREIKEKPSTGGSEASSTPAAA
jgi:hypothetical protein